MSSSPAYTLTPLATTGGQFAEFGPYVPAISATGVVAFQATRRGGGSGVYTVRAGAPEALIESGGTIAEVVSHPDIDRSGRCCFYARTQEGAQHLFLLTDTSVSSLSPGVGPLGPTINDSGGSAFRAAGPRGPGVYTSDGASISPVAEVGERFSAFHGLPVINGRGGVLFRADLVSGGQAIVLRDGDTQRVVAATGDAFSALGAFPAMNDAGEIAFAATLRAGGSAIFAGAAGEPRLLLDSSGPFESFRGVLIDAAGRAVFYATPRGGSLGVFTGPDPDRDRLLSLGAPLLGSTVADFALNPVSINDAGQLAVRVALADGRQLIMRADP